MPKDPRVSAGVACAVVRDSKILLMKRQGSHGAGLWALPGGWIDYGEMPGYTCLRELEEEMGLDVGLANTSFLLFTTNIFPEDKIQSITLYHMVTNTEGEPRIVEPEKCSEIRWVPLETALTMDKLFPGLKIALATIIERTSRYD